MTPDSELSGNTPEDLPARVRVVLPYHLKNLTRTGAEITVEVCRPVTLGGVLSAIEARYPALCGTIRDHVTLKRRPFVRYFACERDWSLEPAETPLPETISSGAEPFLVVGAVSGG